MLSVFQEIGVLDGVVLVVMVSPREGGSMTLGKDSGKRFLAGETLGEGEGVVVGDELLGAGVFPPLEFFFKVVVAKLVFRIIAAA